MECWLRPNLSSASGIVIFEYGVCFFGLVLLSPIVDDCLLLACLLRLLSADLWCRLLLEGFVGPE